MGGIKHCLGVDALDTRSHTMARFVAPVTLLATGGAGQACTRSTFARFSCSSLKKLQWSAEQSTVF